MRRRIGAVLSALLALAWAGAAFGAPVRTSSGLLQGVRKGDLMVYKGVPFAEPPVGALRWRAPRPPKAWGGVREAAVFGHACPQPPVPGVTDVGISEDCLTLNLWRPAAAEGPLPIMVFIHGGGFTTGAGSIEALSGDQLARKRVIAVTVNHRLGPLGYLALPELSRESGRGSGEYGTMDLIAALKWIRSNARAFGGDPDRITVFGQSGGSMSVSLLIASPAAKGLFSRAIGESNGVFSAWPAPGSAVPLAAAEKAGTAWAAALGAHSLAELRKLPPETLLKARANWGAVIGGEVLSESPYEAFAHGRQTDVPTLVGSNDTEGVFFLRPNPNPPISAADWDKVLSQSWGADYARAKALYPFSGEDTYWSYTRAIGDSQYDWQVWAWAGLQSRTGKAAIRMWRLEQPYPVADPAVRRLMGTPHGAETAYVFRHFGADGGRMAWTQDDRALGEQMSSYWANFARTGDPNGPGLPPWPVYRAGEPTVLRLKTIPELGVHPRQAQMELIESAQAKVRAAGSAGPP
jgi:para-nitrobenzyl esterase